MSIISDNSNSSRNAGFLLPAVIAGFGGLLLLASCASDDRPEAPRSGPIGTAGKAKRYNLVRVKDVVPDVKVDLRYKTSDNATGKPLYPLHMPCLLNTAAANKLAHAQRVLKQDGYGILVFDAWRPPESHMALWNAVQDPRYVVPPSDGLSLHCYGIAVDVTLYDQKTGQAVKMPSRFDEFSPRAKSAYTGDDPEIARNVSLLKNAMLKAGFRGIADEWWHYDMPEPTRVYRVTAKDLGLRLPQ